MFCCIINDNIENTRCAMICEFASVGSLAKAILAATWYLPRTVRRIVVEFNCGGKVTRKLHPKIRPVSHS